MMDMAPEYCPEGAVVCANFPSSDCGGVPRPEEFSFEGSGDRASAERFRCARDPRDFVGFESSSISSVEIGGI
jgi:hypothetical protein